jgi:hypothetical protein
MGRGEIAAGRRSYRLWEARPGPMGRGEGAAACLNRKRAFPARFLIGIGKRGFPVPPLRAAPPCAGVAARAPLLFEPEPGLPCPFPHRHRKTRFPDASASRRTSLCRGRGGGAAPTACGRPALGPIGHGEALLFEPETGFPCPFPYRHRKTRFPDASASRRTSLVRVSRRGAAPT